MHNNFWFVLTVIISVFFIVNVSGQDYEDGEDFEDNRNQNFQNVEEPNSEEDATTVTAAPTAATTRAAAVTNSTTPSPAHVIGQVHNVLNNVETLNISGIVDQALGIRNNTPIRNLVNGIIGAVFCNPLLSGFNNCGTRQSWGKKDPKIIV